MNISQTLAGLCLVALLGACGGGGGGTSTPSAKVLTGVFIDSPVNGINFTTATQSGKTNANGEFSYVSGENVTFFIGNVQLPPVAANVTVTPLDIAKTTDINNQVVSNILVLMQSLDEDGNAVNGITIPAAAASKATAAIDFNVSQTMFAANPVVTGLVANSGSVTKTPIAEAVAKAHFQNTLNGTGGSTKINVAPAANAGSIQSVLTGAVVTLDGSTSSDANNDTLTYAWTLTTKPAGSAAALSLATSATPTFSADLPGSYVASLVVNDGKLNSNASHGKVTASIPFISGVYRGGWGISPSFGGGGVAYVSADGKVISTNSDGEFFATSLLTIDPFGKVLTTQVLFEKQNYILNGNSVFDAAVVSGSVSSSNLLNLNLSAEAGGQSKSINLTLDQSSLDTTPSIASIAGDYSDYRASSIFYSWNISLRISPQGTINGKRKMRDGGVCAFTGLMDTPAINQKGAHFANLDMSTCDDQAIIRAVVSPSTTALEGQKLFVGVLPNSTALNSIMAFQLKNGALPLFCVTNANDHPFCL